MCCVVCTDKCPSKSILISSVIPAYSIETPFHDLLHFVVHLDHFKPRKKPKIEKTVKHSDWQSACVESCFRKLNQRAVRSLTEAQQSF